MSKANELMSKLAKGPYGRKPYGMSRHENWMGKTKKPKDTTGGLLDKKDYGDVNADGKLDVRDAVAGHANQKGLKEKFGINVNPKGQLKEGSYSRADEVMSKLANMANVQKFMQQGMSKADAMAKAYPKSGAKSDFGSLSVKAGIDNNPAPTKADRIAGATMNKAAQTMGPAGKAGMAAGKKHLSAVGKAMGAMAAPAGKMGAMGAAAGKAAVGKAMGAMGAAAGKRK